jgi:hypothetical protein
LVVHVFEEHRRFDRDRDQRAIERVEKDTSLQVRLKKRSQPVNTDERASEYEKGGKNPFGSAKPVDTASAYARPSTKEGEVEKETNLEQVPRHDPEHEKKIFEEREEREKLEAQKERDDVQFQRHKDAEKRDHVLKRQHRTQAHDEQRVAKMGGDDGFEGEDARVSSGDYERPQGRRRDDRRDDRRRGRDDRSRDDHHDGRRKGGRARGGWSQVGSDRKEARDPEKKAPVAGPSVPQQKVEHANPFSGLLGDISD